MKNRSTEIELKFLSQYYVDRLYRDVIQTGDVSNYLLPAFPIDQNYAKGSSGVFIKADLRLDPLKSDAQNSRTLYEGLSGMTELQASDERLWVYLSHCQFWEYMQERWPIQHSETSLGRIRDRYFLRQLKLESITRNGISRLWWYAHITYEAGRKDPFELLDVMLSRQDIAVGITERAIGSNKQLRSSILEFLASNPNIAADERKTRELLKAVNLTGGVKLLPAMTKEEVNIILEKVAQSI